MLHPPERGHNVAHSDDERSCDLSTHDLILAVGTGEYYSQKPPPYMRIKKSGILGEIGGTHTFFMSTQVDGGAWMHGSLFPMNLEVHGNTCFLDLRGLQVHTDYFLESHKSSSSAFLVTKVGL